jgi:hypothetical protein
MAEERENQPVAPADEDGFHEETPEEFAAQPDRPFTKVRTPSEDAEADTDGGDKEERDNS